MSTLNDLRLLPNGARFYRADIHVHSYGGSHDVSDHTMTPQGIVSMALQEGLDIISVTDHNEVTNAESAIKAAAASKLYVIPGVELSTENGHLLCYLPDIEALHRFYSRLDMADRGTPNSRCRTSILECLNQLSAHRGFGILAHVDVPGGYETEVTGITPHKVDVLCHSALVAIELKSASSEISYSYADPDAGRRQIGQARVSRLGLGSSYCLARVLNSDSHTLSALGRNAKGDRKVTRIKMDSPTFDALRIAFDDGDARVRLEDQIPRSVPFVLGAHFDGGFLAGQTIHFSPNLNCIIGGRGTGKSTALEGIRCLSQTISTNPLVDSEIWPSKLHLFWQDAAGQQHSLIRALNGDVENLDDCINGPVSFHVECYGQNETAKISQQAEADPAVLTTYLDKFLDIEELIAKEESARQLVLELQTKIEEARRNVDQLPQYERALATTQQQLQALVKANAKDVIEIQRRIAEEREIRNQIDSKLKELKISISVRGPEATVEALQSVASPERMFVGKAELQSILEGVKTFKAHITNSKTDTLKGFESLYTEAKAKLSEWKNKEIEAEKQIDEKRMELQQAGIRLDMAFIQKLTKDEASHRQTVQTLKLWVPHLKELNRQREVALKDRWSARDKIAIVRQAYAARANEALQDGLSDLKVTLKYLPNAYSPTAESLIIEAMGWRTIQVPRASLLVKKLTVPRLLQAIYGKTSQAIFKLKADDGINLFDKADADNIIEKLSEPGTLFALECCMVSDLPKLYVTKLIPQPDGKAEYITRDFSKLSLGQQQSVLLALMLSSESNAH